MSYLLGSSDAMEHSS